MSTFNVHAAKTHLSRLIDKAAAGEEIIIAKAGKPMAKLVALDSGPKKKSRVLGTLAGKMTIPDEFLEPLPDDIIDLFYNGPLFPDEKK